VDLPTAEYSDLGDGHRKALHRRSLASGRALIEAANQLLHLASIRCGPHAAPATSWPGWR
jgi:hypothetical protein